MAAVNGASTYRLSGDAGSGSEQRSDSLMATDNSIKKLSAGASPRSKHDYGLWFLKDSCGKSAIEDTRPYSTSRLSICTIVNAGISRKL